VRAVAPSSGSAYMPQELWWVPRSVGETRGRRRAEAWVSVSLLLCRPGLDSARPPQARAQGDGSFRAYLYVLSIVSWNACVSCLASPITRMTQSCCRRKGRAFMRLHAFVGAFGWSNET
jgi:hypothetical protein